ncbi:MAG: hypothetical protein IJK39_03260, partial [Bacteroidales bacterium]|nr:hypothetical protein [Bacteroidales bacterium]
MVFKWVVGIKKTLGMSDLFGIVACGIVLSSCSMLRGYRADGLDGPGIFSFEHHVHDTIPNGDQMFQFKVAESR